MSDRPALALQYLELEEGQPRLAYLVQQEPTAEEEALAYEILRPCWAMTPHNYVSRMLAGFREDLLGPFERLAMRLPPQAAAQLRAELDRARRRL